MTPIWIFPAYPMLIIGPHAAVLSAYLAASRCFRIIIGGFTIQGVGFLVSLMVYSAYIHRLMTQKLPKENIRPGMFVSVGPSAFTVAAVVNMAADAQRSFPPDFMGDGKLAANVVRVIGSFACLWLWGYVAGDSDTFIGLITNFVLGWRYSFSSLPLSHTCRQSVMVG
jgi:tellurite resistance protein TehA-like permease